MSKIVISTFQEYEAKGYLTCREHPSGELLIWNYTALCQYENIWDEVTILARGLITKKDGTIVSRPFLKFFNLEQCQTIPNEPFRVTRKMDGSLGISYWYNGEMFLATRGSFQSEQSVRANALLKRYESFPFDPSWTYLFEIIYKENRIVVDYGEQEDLILLAMIHTETGEEKNLYDCGISFPFPLVHWYEGVQSIQELKEIKEQNAEGFVVRFENGFRMKMKFEEYVRLHHVLTKCTTRTIWELLKNEQPFDSLLEKVPDEFYLSVKRTKEQLLTEYSHIEEEAIKLYRQVAYLPTRKDQALEIKGTPYADIVFKMIDGRDYKDLIWKRLYPESLKLVSLNGEEE